MKQVITHPRDYILENEDNIVAVSLYRGKAVVFPVTVKKAYNATMDVIVNEYYGQEKRVKFADFGKFVSAGLVFCLREDVVAIVEAYKKRTLERLRDQLRSTQTHIEETENMRIVQAREVTADDML